MYRTRQRLRDAMLESGVIDVVAEVGWFIRHYDVFLGDARTSYGHGCEDFLLFGHIY